MFKSFFEKYYGWITLIILVLLLLIKLTTGKCMLWLCGVFVVTVLVYFIYSDYVKKP
jgi:hypothetical protein